MLKELFAKYKLYFGFAILVLILILIFLVIFQGNALKNERSEKRIYMNNMNAALTECVTWRNKDSLSVAKNDALTLKINELERYQTEDLATINSLKKRNESLEKLITENSETKIEIKTVVRDSIVYVQDSAKVVKKIDWSDQWAEFHAVVDKDDFNATLINRDSLIIATTIEYKRFLNFLWKTKQIKAQKVYVESKNPHTEIENVECINTTK